jgi:lipopolysaccharide transport system ATP-binding protein
MSRAEINRKFDAIVDFAETEKFLDTPVKRYSSGMYVRLAFAVAAHLEPEILIVDEVLAVGDVQFQKKCLGKMEDVAKEGRTVLFVSHNMAAIQQLTNKSILLHQGAVISNGSSVAVVAKYLQTSFQSTVAYDVRNKPRLYSEITSRDVEFCELTFDNTQTNIFSVGSAIDILVTIRGNAKKDKFRFSMTIFRIDGTPVGNFFGPTIHSINNNETAVFKLELRHLNLAPGKYCCALAMGIGNEKELIREFDIISDVLNFEVMFPSDSGTTGTWNSGWGSIIFDAPNIYKVQSN